MPNSFKRLSKIELNKKFIEGLGEKVESCSDYMDSPLLIDTVSPMSLKLRVYLFNCTNPPGGRAIDEFKIQIILPGQKRGERGVLDYSGGRMPIVAAYVPEGKNGVFVFWDAYKHDDFAYSCNMQVKSEVIIRALYMEVASMIRKNGETILAARPEYIYQAIEKRLEIQRNEILKGLE